MRIISNGSKFIGEAPLAVDALLKALETATLDPDFEAEGQTFVRKMRVGKNYRIFGNFVDLSHVFQIVGSLEEIRPIALAIRNHRRSERYQKAWQERFGTLRDYRRMRRHSRKRDKAEVRRRERRKAELQEFLAVAPWAA